ncbi:NAD(P)H-binding protein [Candidatus Haliotispira prima]|uniref:NAD(P)H-binding protein n=1 Tax=Candidatus Haliotispira prima TaxID=3034016 RepID=A0ABY8ML36_9SPIO|nr:NAD(P)H-binding protein [Candidatus Haliotispira prima]
MDKKITVAVFGASGNVGNHFVNQALEAGLTIKAFVRNPKKYSLSENPNVEIIEGNVTNFADVERAVTNADVVISCLGNVKVNGNYITIMHTAHDNILKAASKQTTVPRCIFISTIGCGGTSWLVKQMLTLIVGKTTFADYEKADKRIREENTVPFLLVRPYALTDKEGNGKYYVTKNQNGTFFKPISRADVAKFILNAVTDQQWDGSPGVLLGGAKP